MTQQEILTTIQVLTGVVTANTLSDKGDLRVAQAANSKILELIDRLW